MDIKELLKKSKHTEGSKEYWEEEIDLCYRGQRRTVMKIMERVDFYSMTNEEKASFSRLVEDRAGAIEKDD